MSGPNHIPKQQPIPGMLVGAMVNQAAMPPVAMQHQPGMMHVPGLLNLNPGKVTLQMAPPPPPQMVSAMSQQMAPPTQQMVAPPPGEDGYMLENAMEGLNLANTKEKTPMCLINELARFNKIQHQYTLTDEQGPAHKKTFYVKLKLGEEEYSAAGPSIKKAQHAAAGIALEKTQYKHPPPKPPKDNIGDGMFAGESNMTPTVELNALAMKRGEPAIYRSIEPQRPQYYPPPNFDFRGMYNQRYHYPRCARLFYVSLKVGQREFIGEGPTRQAARHSAAAKAMKVLQLLPLPNQEGGGSGGGSGVKIGGGGGGGGEGQEEDGEDDLKSEISLVHEIALKRGLVLNFEVTRESGPPHMRTFVTRCVCGDFVTDGEGNGKKVSKKRAAESMLDQLRQLPCLPQMARAPKKPIAAGNKKKNRNLIKKASTDYGVGINPISRLIQIQQAKKEKEPVYTLLHERGMPRRREFVMQVTVGQHQCTGVGPNKKLAKRSAAETMLQLLGYSRPAPQPNKPSIKMAGDGQVVIDKKVTFIDQEIHSSSRQLVPGLLLMPDGVRPQSMPLGYMNNQTGMVRQYVAPPTVQCNPQTTAAIAKELLDKGASPTAESIRQSGATPVTPQATVRPKQQLLYLADVLGFQVQFTDFPKGNNKTEYLSLVSLSTSPPQVSHGAGPTIEASHDNAALTGLTALSEMGLSNMGVDTKNVVILDAMATGDGPHINGEVEKQVNSQPTLASNEVKVAVKTEL